MHDTESTYTPPKAGRLHDIYVEARDWALEHGSSRGSDFRSKLPSTYRRDPEAFRFWTETPTDEIGEEREHFVRAKNHHSTRWREINQAMVGRDGRAHPEWWSWACFQRAMHRYAERRCEHYLRALNRWKDSADAFNEPRYDQIAPRDLSDGVRRVLHAVVEYDEQNGRLPHSPGGLFANIEQNAVTAPLQACQDYFDNHDLPAPWRNAKSDREKVEEWVRCARAIFK